MARTAVVGGMPAQPGAFSSVAEIFDVRGSSGGECTGTVVAPTLVLTAAHCAENRRTGVPNKPSGYTVLTSGAGGAVGQQVSKVFAVIVYDGFHRGTVDGDAALLVLSTPVTAPAITLASTADAAAFRAGAPAMLAGFGETYYGQRGLTAGLRWAGTVVQSAAWCRRYAMPFDAGREVCTVDPPDYRTGACQGDSGGPLLAPHAGGGVVEIGITSHGYEGCSTRMPSVFTRVDAIGRWVQAWVAAYAPRPPTPSL